MLKFLIEKEFKQLKRNSFVPRIIVLMPLMMMLVMPYAANQEVKNVRVSVVDNDNSSFSNRLTQKIDASNYFSVTNYNPTYSKALESIESGSSDIILEIEDDFEANYVWQGVGKVMISANAVNGTRGILGSSYMTTVISDYTSQLQQESGIVGLQSGAGSQLETLTVMPQYKFNPKLDYKVFMVPALMVMLLTMLAGFLPALNIVSEKEIGTIEQINVTPVGKLTFIAAKLIPYWIICFVVLSICMVLAATVHGIFPIGSLVTIFSFSSIYILVVSGMGLIVSNYSSTMQQAMFVMYFFIMILLLMSGLFTPVNSMPLWAQIITILNPLKYFIDVMRLVYLKGSEISNLLPQFIALCCFAIGFNIWAVFSYKKSR